MREKQPSKNLDRILALVSLVIACASMWVAWSARLDSRVVALLGREPVINVSVSFDDLKAGQIEILNTGAVSAMHVLSRIILRDYDEEAQRFAPDVVGLSVKLVERELLSWAETALKFDIEEESVLAPGYWEHYDVLELIIGYRTPVERKLIVRRAFYFKVEYGGWISEYDARHWGYDSRAERALALPVELARNLDDSYGDILHRIDGPE